MIIQLLWDCDNNCQVTGGGWWEGACRHCYDINYCHNVCEISMILTTSWSGYAGCHRALYYNIKFANLNLWRWFLHSQTCHGNNHWHNFDITWHLELCMCSLLVGTARPKWSSTVQCTYDAFDNSDIDDILGFLSDNSIIVVYLFKNWPILKRTVSSLEV